MANYTPGPWYVPTLRKRVSVSSVALGAPYAYEVPIVYMADDPLTTDAAEANMRLIASAPALVESLRETLRALEAHLDDDAVHAGLSHRDLLCPCNQNELARAKALLAAIDGDRS